MAIAEFTHKKEAVKRFELGEKVKVSCMYKDLKRKNFGILRSKRYKEEPVSFEGVYVGRRTIHLEGYSEYLGDGAGYGFCSKTTSHVHLVAINHIRTIYVPDRGIQYTEEEFKRLFGDFNA